MSNQKSLDKKSTSTNTATQENQFKGRGFAVQKKSDIGARKPNLNTQLLQAKSFGHSISKLSGQENSGASPQTGGLSIQPKLSIGEPGDPYEQEADRVASVVVQRINAPSSTGQSVQREGMPEEEDELQMKPLADSIQRVEIDDEEEVQMKTLADSIQRAEIDDEEELQMKSQVQCREAIGGEEASTDLESAINSARGGGQSLDAGLQRSIGQAMGADFSGVKVHTDAQADQLNQSIQAKAFTTGQDVFFRQGEYNPGSRGGQELLAHELTHVVQQGGSAVQRSPKNQMTEPGATGIAYTPSGKGTHDIQRVKEASEYTHIVINKDGGDLNTIRDNLNNNGLQTAATRKISLAEGSKKLGHDRHVFMWDDTSKGRKGASSLVQAESTITVKIRYKGLTKGGFLTQGTLKTDNMGKLGKGDQSGAWAYEGNIERKYIFIEGIDNESDPGYEGWKKGEGWPDDPSHFAVKGARAIGDRRIGNTERGGQRMA